jgi:hypothetical protein
MECLVFEARFLSGGWDLGCGIRVFSSLVVLLVLVYTFREVVL